MNKNLLLLVLVGLLIFTACRKEEIKPNTEEVNYTEGGVILKNGTVFSGSDTGSTTSSPGGTSPKPDVGTITPEPVPDKEVLDPSDPYIRKPKKP